MKRKKLNRNLLSLGIGASLLLSCTANNKTTESMDKVIEKGTFGYDLNYLSKKDSLIVLKSHDGKAQVIVSAKYQAKVFTSTAGGEEGNSHGFVNYNFLDAGKIDEHMNGYGGENRMWLGPEGGSYSIFFAPGSKQVYDNWHTPKAIDTEEWDVKYSSLKKATFTKEMQLQNYRGTVLNLAVERTVSLFTNSEIATTLGIRIPDQVKAVAYATENRITNRNDFEWTRETGTVCIWMLDMINPSDSAVTVIPYHAGKESERGKVVTSDYFGAIPANRLIDDEGVLFFKTDGRLRGKLGMNAKRTKTIAGNYDPIAQRLTIVTFDADPEAIYLNQEWNPEKEPLRGDALNAYNDGPLDDGTIMGPFLELESSSPAAFLKPDESLSHRHNVFHFMGDEAALSPIAEQLLGVTLEKVKNIFQKKSNQ